jgi:fructan beta-fructosidase
MKKILKLAVCCGALGLYANDTTSLNNFDNGTYNNWSIEGEAFGSKPDNGLLSNSKLVKESARGKGWVNTYFEGDRTTGTLTSPEFKINKKYITFLIGGGTSDKLGLQLIVDGKVVRFQTGKKDESLSPSYFDVSAFLGQNAQLRIIDGEKGGWGHINIDEIVATDTKPDYTPLFSLSKESTISKKYIILPIRDVEKGNKKGRAVFRMFVDGKPALHYDIDLATSEADTDWYAHFSLENYQGKNAEIKVNLAAQAGFDLIRLSDTIPGEENYYKEAHRPQFHLTHKSGWINDPNGMVYHDGVWHFFYQHNPVSRQWGNMTWGHATSKDLLHWEIKKNKLFPNVTAKKACFSGGATVDKHNTAGWGKNALVAYLTDTGSGECVAYSTDGGESFTYYKGNPLITFDKKDKTKPFHVGRDPKVVWYPYESDDMPINDKAKELGGHWVMVVYDAVKKEQTSARNKENGHYAAFYTSIDMKDWTFQSRIPRYFECTELFELPVDGDINQRKWVIFGANAQYQIGEFDGKKFTPNHQEKLSVHYGRYYASQTFDNAPDGRRIQMGWAQIVTPNGPYNQHFSFPHQLTLSSTADGVRMLVNPIKEIEKLRVNSSTSENTTLTPGTPFKQAISTDLLDVTAIIEVGTAKEIKLELCGRTIVYNARQKLLGRAPLSPIDGKITIRVLADRIMTETIGNNGMVYITDSANNFKDSDNITVTATGGTAKLISVEAHELKSIWNNK